MSNQGLIIAASLTILCTVLFYIFKLETQVKNDGIYVRFFPLQLSFKYFNWQEIDKLYIRQYHPISEYGGWGLRVGFSGIGKAYNMSGNVGLQIEFIDNKKLLIGTNKPDELKKVLNSLGQLKSDKIKADGRSPVSFYSKLLAGNSIRNAFHQDLYLLYVPHHSLTWPGQHQVRPGCLLPVRLPL